MLDGLFKNKTFTRVYPTALMGLAALIAIFNIEVDGAVFFLLIVSAVLISSSRLTDAMLPALILAVFVTRCYDSADTFMARAWVAVPVIFAVIFHFVKYKKSVKIGRSFYGLVAVTAAVTLGGVGTIPASDYFSPVTLFYIFGLGGGMALFYVIVRSHMKGEDLHEIAKIMYLVGIMASFCVLRFYVAGWEEFVETKRFIFFQSSNNLATLLMLSMPFPMYFASKRHVHILSMFLIYLCAFLTGSRGGIFMGSIEFLLILMVYALFYQKSVKRRILYIGIVAVLLFSLFMIVPIVAKLTGVKVNIDDLTTFECIEVIMKHYKKTETRPQLLKRMVEDFKTNPLFGVGIGYKGNSDIYNPKKGAMNWYHMWTAQIVGGLGLLGIAAYLYQLADRIVIFVRTRNLLHLTFFMSYIGLWLMSQLNPGEFCPMPYAALAVTYFALMEDGMPPPRYTEHPLFKKIFCAKSLT